jgi:transcription antitermination factor NusG
MKQVDQVMELVEEISNTITEASELKAGEHVKFKPGTYMAGTIAVVQQSNSDGSVAVRIGGGATGPLIVPATDLLKVPGHPGVLEPK